MMVREAVILLLFFTLILSGTSYGAEKYGYKLGKSGALLYIEGDVATGYETNVFHSPDKVVAHPVYGTKSGLEKSDFFLAMEVGAHIKGAWNEKNKYKAGVAIGGKRYSNHDVLDETTGKVKLDSRHKINKRLKIKLHADFRKKERDETNIFGDKYIQEYSYRSIYTGPDFIFVIRPEDKNRERKFGETLLTLKGRYKDKDYDEPPAPYESYDYTEHRSIVAMEQVIAEKYQLELEYDQRAREYREDLAKEANGGDNVLGKKRELEYRSIMVGVKAKLNKRGKVAVELTAREREDTYQDYDSYSAKILDVHFDYDFDDKNTIEVKGDYETRKYKRRTAPSPGVNPKLDYTYFDFSIEYDYKFHYKRKLYLEFERKSRDSNTEDENISIRRAYTNYVLWAGVKVRY